MANFATLTAQLNLNIQNFAQNMQRASSTASAFASNLNGQINTGMIMPAQQAGVEFKDVARIVQGIIISQVFYSGLKSIRRATDAVWAFSNELEYAKMVYSNLFGDTDLALEFINILKDFAAVTPFSFKQSEQAAKRLLAYGIEYKNIMFVMQGVLAAATVQGNDAIIEPISRAMGQIYTKGRLMNEEMRQLAEAGIPVYEILQEKLNLTAEQLRNLGRTAIPAHIAINALIEGINERFSTTLQYAAMTTRGIISNIRDNAVMLFAGIFEPLTDNMKNSLSVLGNFINELRSIFELKGLGGVFERLVPASLHQSIRQLIGAFRMLWEVLKSNLSSVVLALKYLLRGLLDVFNALAPVIVTLMGIFAALSKSIVENEKFMKTLTTAILAAAMAWVVYKLKVLAAAASTAVIKVLTTAVSGLVVALNFLAAHPIWSVLMLGAGLFIVLTGSSEKFRNSINSLYKSLVSLSGVDVSKLFAPESKERASDVNKFNNALEGTSKGMDDLAKSTSKAAKAAGSLLGFDEVFSLRKPAESASVPDASSMPEDLEAASNVPFPAMDFKLPEIAEMTTGFVDNLLTSLGGHDKLLGAGIGALLGAALGGLIGGPLGVKIGALLGGIAGWFWDEFVTKLGLTDIGKIALPIATILGTAIGYIIGGPLGAIVGAAIGGLVGWIIDAVTRGIQTGDWSNAALPIGLGIGASIGFLAGGPIGALIGTAIGGLTGWITGLLIDGFTNGKWDISGISIGFGTAIGAAIGMVAFGPVGALIGGAVGALFGWLIGLIAENWEGIKKWFNEIFTGIGQFFMDTAASIGQFFMDIAASIGQFFVGIWKAVSDAASEFFSPVTTAFGEAYRDISAILSNIWGIIVMVSTDIASAVSTVSTDLYNGISTILSRVWQTTKNILVFIKDLFIKTSTDIYIIVTDVLSDLLAPVRDWFQKIWGIISVKLLNIWTSVSDWFQKIWDVISEKLQGAWDSVISFFNKIGGSVIEKVTSIWSSVSEGFQNVHNAVSEKLFGTWQSVTKFFSGMYNTVKDKISNMYSSVKSGITDIYGAFKNWISDMWSNVFNKFFNWIDDGIKKLREFFRLNSRPKTSYTIPPTTSVTRGHAVGGVFNKEHIARFAEGNKAEAIIPLENDAAMQPFVDAVSNGLSAALMPIIANVTGQHQLRPLYVGTLIADERGLKELNRKMEVIKIEEEARRG